MSDIPIFSADGRVVGSIRNGVLYKTVQKSKHLLRMPVAWAWDEVCLEQAKGYFVSNTEVYDSENNITYRTSIDLFYEKGVHFERNHNKQIFLTLKFWTTKPGENTEEQLKLL